MLRGKCGQYPVLLLGKADGNTWFRYHSALGEMTQTVSRRSSVNRMLRFRALCQVVASDRGDEWFDLLRYLEVERLVVESGDTLFWDRDRSSFGVRVYATGRKIYVVRVQRPTGKPKRVKIGEHGKIEPEPTMADLAERYVKAHLEVNCRSNTVKTFRRVLNLHILPELGHLPVASVERSHVSELHFKMWIFRRSRTLRQGAAKRQHGYYVVGKLEET